MKRAALLPVLATLAVASLISIGGCANRYREGSSGKTPEQVRAHLDNIVSKGFSRDANGMQKAMAMVDDDSTNVYFAEANGPAEKEVLPMGPIHAVLPLEFDVLESGLSTSQIKNIRAYFIDRLTDGGHEGALILEITKVGADATPLVIVFLRDGNSTAPGAALGDIQDDDTFTMTLDGDLNSTKAKPGIVLLTEDIDKDLQDLRPVIQLELNYEDINGEEFSMGQISTMVGYGR